MKNLNKILLGSLILSVNYCYSQGWIGNSGNLYPLNQNNLLMPLKVGIGTSSPSEQLHTTAGVVFQGLTPASSNSINRIIVQDNSGKLYWKPLSSIQGLGNYWNLNGNQGTIPGTGPGQHFMGTTDNNRIVFATNSLEKMTIMPNGEVGVGTANPTNKLQVYNSSSDNHLAIGGSAPSIKFHDNINAPAGAPNPLGLAYSKIGLATHSGDFVIGSKPGDMILQTINNTNAIIFSNKFTAGGNGTEQMRLSHEGYLGINVAAPTAVLHTDGAVRHENLVEGSGNILVVDAQGNVYKSTALAKTMNDAGLQQEIEKQKDEITYLKSEIANLKRIVSSVSNTNTISYLYQNSPNPFSEITKIKFKISESAKNIAINIYNMNGDKLKSYTVESSNENELIINSNEFKSGVYVYSLSVDDQIVDTKSMIITK